MARRGITLRLGLAFGPASKAQSWPNGYSFRRTITIDHTKVPNTDQTNFPVLISGTYSFLATTANGGNVTSSGGYDIIFTSDANGATPLAFGPEIYNAQTGSVVYWVKVPALSHATDTVFYLFYGNSSVTTDQSNKTGVWDANYVGVWHLANGSTLNPNDSTSNGKNGTNHGAIATSGQIDGAASFSASSAQYISVADTASLDGANLSFSFWVNRGSASQTRWAHAIEKGNGNGAPWGSYYFQFNNSGSDSSEGLVCIGMSDASDTCFDYGSGAFLTNTWYMLTATYDSATGWLSSYKNGIRVSTNPAPGSKTIKADTGPLRLSGTPAYGENLNGTMDEVEVSNAVRSADWIATEYNNQSSPSTFYSLSAANLMPSITTLSPGFGAVGTSVTITGSNFGAAQADSSATLNGTPCNVSSWSSNSIVFTVPGAALWKRRRYRQRYRQQRS